jgi:anti-sigma factor RsiW
MKASSLHALVIDRHAGELTPEAAELLDLHLAQNAEARAEAERILASLAVTQDAVLRHPELARVMPAPMEKAVVAAPRRSFFKPWLARAAVMALLAAIMGIAGFVAGRSESRMVSNEDKPSAPVSRKESPWARYRMSFDPDGEGVQVVRVDTSDLKTKAIP